MTSDAVGVDLISKVVGYKITKGNFSNETPNLPQRILIIGEANEDNQSSVNFDTQYEITSAQQAGQIFGYGSPIHMAMRILRPFSGTGVGSIPTIVIPQEKASGATEKIMLIEVAGTATKNTTHTVVIAGRRGLDGTAYDFTVNTGDTATEIHQKIEDAVNAVLGCPFLAESTGYEVTLTSKWNGLTANGLTVTIDTNDVDAGLTYSVSEDQAGAGTPALTDSLAAIGNDWFTVVVNTYGTVSGVMDALEAFNGIPDPTNPTGRFASTIMKPFFAFTGSTVEDPSSITDSRKEDVTIVICPAPESQAHPLEAAANCASLYAPQAQNNPHMDISGNAYPDMPIPSNGQIGAMATYTNRDNIVKKGCSTVELVASRYVMADFVTTYHPDGEIPPQFRYVRNLTIDFNIRFKYFVLEQLYVVNKSITSNSTVTTVAGVIRPMQWKQILFTMFDQLAASSLIAEPSFSKESAEVNIGTSNPDRFETFFRYKRTGFSRISSTTAEAGFNFNS